MLLPIIAAWAGIYTLYRVYLYLTVGAARRRMIKENGCKPAAVYPHWDPIFGLDLVLNIVGHAKRNASLEAGQKRFHKHGNTYTHETLGTHMITTCEPENVKTVLSLKFSDYSLSHLRKIGFLPLFGTGIFTTDGKEWEHSRAMLRPNFSRSQIADLDTFETHIGHLIQQVPKDGSTVDLQELFFDLTLDSATEFLFGQSANTLLRKTSTPEQPSFSDAFTYATTAMGKSFRWMLLDQYFVKDNEYDKSQKIVHDFADRYVAKVLQDYKDKKEGRLPVEEKEGRYVFLRELVEQTQDPLMLRSEALNILLAGRDTTASLLGNVWNIISKRPDVWQKLQTEVDELAGRRPTFEQIKNMKYLKYVLNESLRLWPIVASNSRSANRDTVLPRGGGPDGKSPVFVAKGTMVNYSVYSMHRREDIYGADAAEFKPERWEKLRPSWEYLPFNGGPRICLGQQFALTEASYATIRLMQHFRTIESRDSEPWQEGITITCASKHGAKVSLRP
ncbi:hypothetical protein FQN50_004620 [Emmonsiellopsis sp. PD_5]|nr:hypothetical protein FQN50_004620 [Emmonsiellopsis sp. PD_5]